MSLQLFLNFSNTCHSLSLASVKSRLVLPVWYRLTWVVPGLCVSNTYSPMNLTYVNYVVCIHVVSMVFNSNCFPKMNNFSWLHSLQAVTYSVKVVVSKKQCETDTSLHGKYHMAYRFMTFPMTLQLHDLEDHSPVAGHIKCSSRNICATHWAVSTDMARRAMPQWQLSFLLTFFSSMHFRCCLNFGKVSVIRTGTFSTQECATSYFSPDFPANFAFSLTFLTKSNSGTISSFSDDQEPRLSKDQAGHHDPVRHHCQRPVLHPCQHR